MRTYLTGSANEFVFTGFLALFIGSIFFVPGTFALLSAIGGSSQRLPESTGGRVVVGIVVIVEAASVHLGWKQLWLRAHRVTLPGDGSVELRAVLRSRKVSATEITSIERAVMGIGFEGADGREALLHGDFGTTRIPYCDDIESLIADIQRLNPAIITTGEWPT